MKKILFTALLLFNLNFSIAQVPSNVPSNGLVGWWPFSGNANDVSGNGNNGTVLNGTTLSTDRFNNTNSSYVVDGINCPNAKGVSLPASINNSNSYTISVWFYTNDSAKEDQTLFNTFPHSYLSVNFNYPFSGLFKNKTCAFFGNGTWQITGASFNWNTYQLTNWHHVVVVKTTSNVMIYQDGKLCFIQPILSTYNSGSFNSIVLGAISINGGSQCYETLKGKVDDVGIWSRALDSAEVKLLYNGCDKKITQHPSDYTTSSRKASFSCQGNDTFQSYQWQVFQNGVWTNLKDSAQFSGSKTSNLLIKQLLSKNNGQKFRCQVKGKCLNDISKIATLNYNCPGTITQQPINQGMFNGQARFTCKSNDTLLLYQWQSNIGIGWNNLSNAGQYTGVNSDTIKVSNVTSSNNNQLFRCVIKGDCLTDTTDEVSLRVWGVGINEVEKLKVNIYPNPAGDFLKVRFAEKFKTIQLMIYDVTGKVLVSKSFNETDELMINISELTEGIYNVQLNVDGSLYSDFFNKD